MEEDKYLNNLEYEIERNNKEINKLLGEIAKLKEKNSNIKKEMTQRKKFLKKCNFTNCLEMTHCCWYERCWSKGVITCRGCNKCETKEAYNERMDRAYAEMRKYGY